MILKYSSNPFLQAVGITFYNWGRLLVFTIWSGLVVLCHWHFGEKMDMTIPMVPISILGGALAIFLAFRNSSAYDRWWEARKIWGAIVNSSRSFTMQILAYSSNEFTEGKVTEEELKTWQRSMVYRHIAWLYALKSLLRKEGTEKEVNPWLDAKEYEFLKEKTNIPTHLLNIQGQQLRKAHEAGVMEQFRLFEMVHTVQDFYDHQGKCERIKNTVFPFYYNYFTRLFLWVFTILLPFGFVKSMGWITIPMSVVVSFVFAILEKSGSVTEDPFESRASDTPMQTICRSIEIDLREMIGEDANEIADPVDVTTGKFKIIYRL